MAYALGKILPLVYQLGHDLCGVDFAVAQFGEDFTLGEYLASQLCGIGKLHHRADGKAAQMRMHRDGLRLAVADGSDALVAVELAQVGLELDPEV